MRARIEWKGLGFRSLQCHCHYDQEANSGEDLSDKESRSQLLSSVSQ